MSVEGKRKSIFYLLLAFLSVNSFNCGFYIQRFAEPKSTNIKPGAVGFCLSPKIKGGRANDLGARDKMELVRKIGDKFVPANLPVIIEEKNGVKISNIVEVGNACYWVTGLEPEGDYALANAKHAYRDHGPNGDYYYEYNLKLDPNQSYSVMPIHYIPGKLVFLGNFVAEFEVINSQNDARAILSFSEKLERAEKGNLEYLMYIHKNEKDSYWKFLIEKRQKELGG